MSSLQLRPTSSVTMLIPALGLLLVSALPRFAAAAVVEMETNLHGAIGKLQPAARSFTPEIDPASEEGQQALTRMKLPEGLKATLWAAEPMLANPVAFNLDEQGRVFVAETHRYGTSVLDIREYMWMLEDDLAYRTQEQFLTNLPRLFGADGVKALSRESERLMLLEDTNGDGVADKSSVYADNFRTPITGIASGVMIHRGEVWFSNIPALWKFTGKDKAETRTELFRGFGIRFNYTGHDFHGLILGPDGRVYFSIGDRAASVPTKEGTVISAPDTGSVFRCWPDGRDLELFATGLRNPQSLLFNEYGDLFTGDNDCDNGDEERLVHLVENGDYGWRVGYQHAPRGKAGPWISEQLWRPRHEGQPAYLLPPICNIEDGPSGIAYYPGTGLTPAYTGTMFITHFRGAITTSGIFTYKVKPAGASYAIDTSAPFLTNALPTDVRFSPDGKLYYSDWAEGWPKSKRGRIYTIFDPKRLNDPLTLSTQKLIADDDTKKSDRVLIALLSHADWRVRLEAQYTLAERGEAGITAFNQALTGNDPLARRHSVWGLGQIARHRPTATAALRPLLSDADAEIRAQTVKTLGDLRDTASAEAFSSALGNDSARVKFFAAQALGKIKYVPAYPALLSAILSNHDRDAHLRHALVMGLVGCATSEQLVALANNDASPVRLAAVLALRRLGDAGITAFLTDSDPLIFREVVEAINDAPIPAATPALAALINNPSNDEAVMLRVLNANFRMGASQNATALAAYADRDNAPAVLRKEAINLLALWPAPPARDRIVGIFRPLAEKSRPARAAADALAPLLDSLLAAHTPDNVQTAAIDAVLALGIKSASPNLRAVVADRAQSTSVRVAALKVLSKFDDDQLAGTVAFALASDVPALRITALPISSRLAPESAVANLSRLIAVGTPNEKQTAFQALGAAKDPAADDVILSQLARFAAGQVIPAAQLELLDAAALRTDPRIKKVLAEREAMLARDPDPLAPFRACLEGGDAKAGRDIFIKNPLMQCIRCHRAGENGAGDAGPNLSGIAARVSREYLLESIIKPSARIAAGFEIVTVTKKNGEAIVGTMVHRDSETVQLKTSVTDRLIIPAADIKGVESAPSAMPEIAALVLTKAEIRNLVEGLAQLTEPVKPTGQTRPLRALRHLDPQ